MPNSTHELLCSYHYDALDRLASRSPIRQPDDHCFYQKNRLITQIQAQLRRSWLQTPGQLLAQQRRSAEGSEWALVATDTQGSVLHGLGIAFQQAYTYAVYGNRHPVQDLLHLPGFNREQPDPVTGHYLLGNGYRAFNPVLMRFNSPDSESPFGKGGLNAYAYCVGDPVNDTDPTGHMPMFVKVYNNRPSPDSSVAIRSYRRLSEGVVYTEVATPSSQQLSEALPRASTQASISHPTAARRPARLNQEVLRPASARETTPQPSAPYESITPSAPYETITPSAPYEMITPSAPYERDPTPPPSYEQGLRLPRVLAPSREETPPPTFAQARKANDKVRGSRWFFWRR